MIVQKFRRNLRNLPAGRLQRGRQGSKLKNRGCGALTRNPPPNLDVAQPGNRGNDLFVCSARGQKFSIDAPVSQHDNSVGHRAHVGQAMADENDSFANVTKARNVGENVGRLNDRQRRGLRRTARHAGRAAGGQQNAGRSSALNPRSVRRAW